MANALAELFNDIAESIRGGLPDAGKMKPAIFPEKIDDIVKLIGSGGGGSGGGVNFMRTYVSGITATWGYRVSVDFGFKPDLLFVLPSSMTAGKNCVYWGCTQAFADAFGADVFAGYSYITNTQTVSIPIDTDNTNAPIYNADATGFNFGKTPSAGSAYVFAIGL